MQQYICARTTIFSRSIYRVVSSYNSSSVETLTSSNVDRPRLILSPLDKKRFHNSSKNHGNAKNLARDTRMAGRRRFFKTVDILPISPPWESMKDSTDVALLDNPISAGVDGSNSATNISLEKPTVGTMKKYLSPTLSSSSLSPSMAQWYGVTLDGRLLKTPMGTTLSVPSLPLALAVASEWDDQGTYIKPAQMPLMTLVCTTLDQLTIPAVRERTVEDLLRYLRNDTTCYWADAIEDRVLHRKQQKHWEDLHNWIDCEIRGLGMKPARAMGAGEGLVMSRMRASKQFAGLPHSEEMIDNAKMFLNGCDSWKLAAMQTVTMEAKSFLVGMAVVRGVEGWVDSINRLVDGEARPKGKPNPFFHDTKKAVLASRVEEEFQIDNWGLVEGGHDYDRLNCSIQIHAATSLIQSIAFPYATYSSSY